RSGDDPLLAGSPRDVRRAMREAEPTPNWFDVAADGSFRVASFSPEWTGRLRVVGKGGDPLPHRYEIFEARGVGGPLDAGARTVGVRAPAASVLLRLRRSAEDDAASPASRPASRGARAVGLPEFAFDRGAFDALEHAARHGPIFARRAPKGAARKP